MAMTTSLREEIDRVFGYESNEPESDFNRKPWNMTIRDMTGKHRHDKDYVWIVKDLENLIQQEADR